jgi:hypothetical protein
MKQLKRTILVLGCLFALVVTSVACSAAVSDDPEEQAQLEQTRAVLQTTQTAMADALTAAAPTSTPLPQPTDLPTSTATQIPTMATPPKLSIEEYVLASRGSEGDFIPVEGTLDEVLSKHQDERAKQLSTNPPTDAITLGEDKLTATATISDDKVTVQVFRNDEPIYTAAAGDATPISPLRGLWVSDSHWILEAAHIAKKTDTSNVTTYDILGEVIQDGVSMNEQYGYEETFGFQLIKGRPFYFFKKDGLIGISYNEEATSLEYTAIPHYGCCSAAAFNPRSAENMVAFFASRGEVEYYVEIGVFE